MGQGNGVSIGVSANAGQAKRELAGLTQGLGKLSQTTKNLFGGNSAQQVNNYNKHLTLLERNLERVNQRMKTLQGTQSALIQQQRQLQQSGGPGASAQLKVVERALQQNQRSMSFWQAKQAGAQASVGYAQQNRPGVGGGGGGIAQFFAGQFSNAAGGLGGTVLKALGIGALAKGAAEVVSKAFMTALDEQKGFADLAPRMRYGVGGSTMSSPKGYMNNLRDMSMPLGYSGIEALKIGSAMSSGSSGRGLMGDTHTAMQMGRMFGIDAGGQASMLAEGGKMGAFVPGQAKRFAEMLAREIGATGLGPRAQEVQEATLMLMHRQLATSATASPASAMALQTVLAKTGLPGFQGAQGAGVLSNFQNAVTGATDDPSIAFLEATARDQMGISGYYNMRRLHDQGPLNNPKLFAGYFQEARKLSANPNAAKDIMSKVGGMTFTQAEQIYDRTHGYRDITSKNVMSIKNGIMRSGGLLDKSAREAMDNPGNQFRKGEATVSGVMARGGTPMVQGIGTLVDKASTQIQNLMRIADSTKSMDDKMGAGVQSALTGLGVSPQTAKKAGNAVVKGMKAINGIPDELQKGDTNYQPAPLPRNAKWDAKRGLWYTPQPKGQRTAPILPPAFEMEPGGSQPIKRSDAGGAKLHIHVSFDHTGAIHPHVKMAFVGMVKEAMDEVQRQEVRGNLHHRYPRA